MTSRVLIAIYILIADSNKTMGILYGVILGLSDYSLSITVIMLLVVASGMNKKSY